VLALCDNDEMDRPGLSQNDGNIGASEQRKRLLFGILAVVAAIAWAMTGRASSLTGAVVLFLLFWFGALGILQAKEKT
jgi:hypothetical protein